MTKVAVIPVGSEEQTGKYTDPDTQQEDTDMSVMKSLRPLEVSMLIGGMLFEKGSGYRPRVQQCYSTFVLALHVLLATRYFYMYSTLEGRSIGNPRFIISTGGLFWHFQFLAYFGIFYIHNWRGTVYNILGEVSKIPKTDSRIRGGKFQKRLQFLVILVWGYTFFNNLMVIYFSLSDLEAAYIMSYPLGKLPSPGSIAICFAAQYSNLSWIVPATFNTLLISIIVTLVQEHVEEVERLVENGNCSPQLLECSRQRLGNITDFIDTFDGISCSLNGANYSLNVVVTLLQSYSLVNFTSSGYEGNKYWLIGVGFWMAMSMIYLAIPTIAAASINCHVSHINVTYYLETSNLVNLIVISNNTTN